MDPGEPKRGRTVAIVGAGVAVLAALGAMGFFVLSKPAEAPATSANTAATVEQKLPAGNAAKPAAPAPTTAPVAEKPAEVDPSPAESASSTGSPSRHAPASTQPRFFPKPAAAPTSAPEPSPESKPVPKPAGDKYGF